MGTGANSHDILALSVPQRIEIENMPAFYKGCNLAKLGIDAWRSSLAMDQDAEIGKIL